MTCCEKVFFDDLEYNWTYRGVAKILSSKLPAKPIRRLICVCRADSVRKAYCLDSSLKKSSRPWRISWVCWDEIATTRILNSKRCFSIDEIYLTVAPRAIYLTAKLTGHKDTMLKLEQPSSRLLYKWNVRGLLTLKWNSQPHWKMSKVLRQNQSNWRLLNVSFKKLMWLLCPSDVV